MEGRGERREGIVRRRKEAIEEGEKRETRERRDRRGVEREER